jgi:hypothetical protein
MFEVVGPLMVIVVLIVLLLSVTMPATLVTAMLSLMTYTVWRSTRDAGSNGRVK